MTQDELFTAIYLVCGALPRPPQMERSAKHMAIMCRREVSPNVYQHWMIDETLNRPVDYDVRITHDPAYIEYFEKAAPMIRAFLRGVMTSHRGGTNLERQIRDAFGQFIQWAEQHEQRGQKVQEV